MHREGSLADERRRFLAPTESFVVEGWLRRHSGFVVLAVIAAGLAIRIASAQGSYLTADEATHFELVNVPLADLYRSTLREAHPPFFFFLLHFWHLVGNTEFFLRLLPALFGMMFLGAAYLWAREVFGKGEAFLTLVILTFSPALVSLSAEVRGYSLLLLLLASALAILERAIETRSAALMAAFSGLLYLAILTHYAALWFTLAVFAYVLVRIRTDRLPPRFALTWLSFQAGAAVLYLGLYLTHYVRLRGGELERHAVTRWLRPEYFHPDQESALQYLGRQTLGLFRSLLGAGVVAYVGLLLAFAGVLVLVWRRRRPAALLLVLPVLVSAAAGIAGIYPYGGTRHSVYLLLFLAAAIGVAGSAATMDRRWPSVLMILVLAPVSCPTRIRPLPEMTSAMGAFRSAAPQGGLVFADSNTGVTLTYYLGRDELSRELPGRARFRENHLSGNHRLIRSMVWSFNEKTFVAEIQRFLETYRPIRGQPIWLIRLGAEYDPRSAISRHQIPLVVRSQIRSGDVSILEVASP